MSTYPVYGLMEHCINVRILIVPQLNALCSHKVIDWYIQMLFTQIFRACFDASPGLLSVGVSADITRHTFDDILVSVQSRWTESGSLTDGSRCVRSPAPVSGNNTRHGSGRYRNRRRGSGGGECEISAVMSELTWGASWHTHRTHANALIRVI